MSMYKVLLLEDEVSIGHLIRKGLEKNNYEVNWVMNGERAWLDFTNNTPDICVFDIMVPQKDGFTLTKEIRKKDWNVPIIFITAKSMDESVDEGFLSGGDDYLIKPFRIEELLHRMSSLLRRSALAETNTKNIHTIGQYSFNVAAQTLHFQNEIYNLSFKEASLLETLILYKNRVLTREYAVNHIWKKDNYFDSRSLDVYILRLRKHLKKDPSIQILNIWGEGFKLIEKKTIV